MQRRSSKRKAAQPVEDPKAEKKARPVVPNWNCEYKGCKEICTTFDLEKNKWFCGPHYKIKCKHCKKVEVDKEDGACKVCDMRHVKNGQCEICHETNVPTIYLNGADYCKDCAPACDFDGGECDTGACCNGHNGKVYCREHVPEEKVEEFEKCSAVECENEAKIIDPKERMFCSDECHKKTTVDECNCGYEDDDAPHKANCNLNNEHRIKKGLQPICVDCEEPDEKTTKFLDEWYCNICHPICDVEGCPVRASLEIGGRPVCKGHRKVKWCQKRLCRRMATGEYHGAGWKCHLCVPDGAERMFHDEEPEEKKKCGVDTDCARGGVYKHDTMGFVCTFHFITETTVLQCGLCGDMTSNPREKNKRVVCNDCKNKKTCKVTDCKSTGMEEREGNWYCLPHFNTTGLCTCGTKLSIHAPMCPVIHRSKLCSKCTLKWVWFKNEQEEKEAKEPLCDACKPLECYFDDCDKLGFEYKRPNKLYDVHKVGDRQMCRAHRLIHDDKGVHLKCAAVNCNMEGRFLLSGFLMVCSETCKDRLYVLNKGVCIKCGIASVFPRTLCVHKTTVHCWRCCDSSREKMMENTKRIMEFHSTVQDLI